MAINPLDKAKGEAFEWLVGLLYQQVKGDEGVIPQGRLLSDRGMQRQSHLYVDFYCYDPSKRDGEIVEAKWRNSPEELIQTVRKLKNAASSPENSGVNTHTHINIDTSREDRRIQVVTHEKLPGFETEWADYHSLKELVTDAGMWPLIAADEHLDAMAGKGNLTAVENVRDVLYNLFMSRFQDTVFSSDFPSSIQQLEQYVSEFFRHEKLVPREDVEFSLFCGLEQFGTAHAEPYAQGIGNRHAKTMYYPNIEAESSVIYLRRHPYSPEEQAELTELGL